MINANLVISGNILMDMEGDTFMSPSLIPLSFKYLFMSWLFDSRIMFNKQVMLVYVLMGLALCWNVYLQIMLRKNNKIILDLLNNFTPSAPLRSTATIRHQAEAQDKSHSHIECTYSFTI